MVHVTNLTPPGVAATLVRVWSNARADVSQYGPCNQSDLPVRRHGVNRFQRLEAVRPDDRVGTLVASPYFAVKTPIGDSQYGPHDQSATHRECKGDNPGRARRVWWKTPVDDSRYGPCNQSDTREDRVCQPAGMVHVTNPTPGVPARPVLVWSM
jgi:hypothetical protein